MASKPNLPRPSISGPEKALMLMLAIILEAISLVPGLNLVAVVIGTLTVTPWRWVRMGRRPFLNKLIHAGLFSLVITILEAIPGVSTLVFGWFILVLTRILRS